MRAAVPLLLLLFASLSFAGQLWVFGADGAVSTRPAPFGNVIVIGTDKGYVYGIEAGAQKWMQRLNGSVVGDPAVFGDKAVVATDSTVYAISSNGLTAWKYDIRGVRGVAAAADKVYVAHAGGITALDWMGKHAWSYNATEANEPSAELAGYVIFSSGRKLIILRSTGERFGEFDLGPFWNTRPMAWSGKAYAGTSEGKLYCIDVAQNAVLWAYNAEEMTTTTPAQAGAYVVFGTANGRLYAVNNGELAWKAQLDSMPEGEMAVEGGVIYLSTRKSFYGISSSDGSIVMKRQFNDWPHPPAVIGGKAIVGTQDGKLYAIDTSRACSFLYPQPDALVGDADVNVLGKSYSRYGTARTYVRLEGGQWAEVGGESWEYVLDPSPFPYGVIQLECYVSDAAGMEAGPFNAIKLVKGDAPKPKMKVRYPTSAREGEPFVLTVVDYAGEPLPGVTAAMGGRSFSGNGTITINPQATGLQKVVVSKKGYEDVEFTVNVAPQPAFAYIMMVVSLAGIAAYAYFGYIKKR